MDLMQESMIAETLSQCSYNTAYKALRRVRHEHKVRRDEAYLMLWCSVDFNTRSDVKY